MKKLTVSTSDNSKILLLARLGAWIVLVLSWLKVFISPTIAGGIIGGLAYLYFNQSITGEIAWVVIAFIGMVLGTVWAEHVRKKIGLIEFHAKLIATPELDHPEPERPRQSSDL